MSKPEKVPMDETFMRRCLDLAEESRRSGETPVGALVARSGEILGEGLEATRSLLDPSAHAEVQALRAACQAAQSLDLAGVTLYTTVEPCVLCAYAIRRAGVSRIVYGIPAGQAGVPGWPPPPEITAGVLGEECTEMLRRPRMSERWSR